MRKFLMTGALLAVFLGIGASANYSRLAGSDDLPIPDSRSTLRSLAPLSKTSTSLRMLSAAVQGHKVTGPTVETDKFDYQPGETVQISGSGFLGGEQVTIQVLHANGMNDGVGHDPFDTFADQDGAIKDQWYVHPDDSLHSLFILTAEGRTSGLKASAIFSDAFFYQPDDGGVDDVNSNQVDLNRMGTDEVNLPTTLGVQWNWDDTAWTGGNTGDACALFDTIVNGRADYALCVKVGLSPSVFQATSLFSCNDTRSDRCAGPTLLWGTLSGQPAQPSNSTTSCGASRPANSDPFGTGPAPGHGGGNDCNGLNCKAVDTVAACSVDMNDINATDATMINVCTYPSGEPNSNPFDCVITPDNGFLTIKKVAPQNDTTTFSFKLGPNQTSQTGQSNWSRQGSGDVITQLSFRPGTYTVLETIPSGFKLDSASCAIQTAPPTGTGTGPATTPVLSGDAGVSGLTIQSGLETICTFTNSVQSATLIVEKEVINDNGGTKKATDFSFSVNGANASSFVQDGTNELKGKNTITVSPGTYTITEPAVTGYTTTPNNCTGIQLAAGGTATCKFTNNDQAASLTVIKHVVNNNGGTKVAGDFTMNVTGTNVSDSSFPGAESPGTTVTLDAGQYSVDEDAVSGYTKSIGQNCSGSIANGESKSCTITNHDDAATLIVIKHVINDNGGTKTASQFTINVTGTNVSDDSFPGEESPGTTVTLDAGTYSVDEAADAGYDKELSADCSGTIANGQTKTCTITNNDKKASPALATVQRAVLHDTATLTGLRSGASDASSATVTFSLFTDDTCSTQVPNTVAEQRPISLVNNVPTASTVTGVTVSFTGPSQTFYWKVFYSGDAFNNPKTECAVERVTVNFNNNAGS